METSRVNLTELGIVLATDKGHLVHAVDIPVDISPLVWKPEPKLYDIIRGEELQNGMVVRLINVLGSRFMLVTDFVQYRHFVEFNGVYSDGSINNVRYGHSVAWAVLKEKNVILALTPEQAMTSLVETMFKDIPGWVSGITGDLFNFKQPATDIRSDDEQETDSWAEGIFNGFQHEQEKSDDKTFVPTWAGTSEIPAVDDMSDEEREWYLQELNASSAEKHAEKIVGPQKKTAATLKILDIIELFDTSYVVMDILRNNMAKGFGFTICLRDLETRKNAVNLEISMKTEIKVLGSLV